MKKSLCLLAVSLLSILTSMADVVTPSRALEIAEEFLGEDLAPQRVRGVRGVTPAAEQENAPLYVISRGDGKGFVLVSGDDCLPAIIGYTDHGNFDENDLPPALQDIMSSVEEAVRAAQKGHLPAREPKTARADWHTIDPLITTHWHQGSPYNDLCPICPDNGERAAAGCVAVAVAQAVYYFRKDLPHELQDTTATYSGGSNYCDVTVSYPKGTPIEYDLMLDSYSGSEPVDIKQAVALLCYVVGVGAQMDYWHSSGTNTGLAIAGMNKYLGLVGSYLNRNDKPLEQWENIIYTNLAEGRPLVFAGTKADGGGHSIVLDGYDAKSGLWHFNFG